MAAFFSQDFDCPVLQIATPRRQRRARTTRALETALGVQRQLYRRAHGGSQLEETERIKRGRIPGLSQAIAAYDLKLPCAFFGEPFVYVVGRRLPENATLPLISCIPRM